MSAIADQTGLPIPAGYSDILAAIADAVRATGLFRPAARIEPAPGPLTEAWLEKNAMPHGGALPALAGVDRVEPYPNGMTSHLINLGLYFMPAPAGRNRQAGALADDVSAVLSLIETSRWGLGGARPPAQLRAVNRYSRTLDAKGTTLWTIDWQQGFYLDGQGGKPTTWHVSGGAVDAFERDGGHGA